MSKGPFVVAGQPQGGGCIWKFRGGNSGGGENNSRGSKCPPKYTPGIYYNYYFLEEMYIASPTIYFSGTAM